MKIFTRQIRSTTHTSWFSRRAKLNSISVPLRRRLFFFGRGKCFDNSKLSYPQRRGSQCSWSTPKAKEAASSSSRKRPWPDNPRRTVLLSSYSVVFEPDAPTLSIRVRLDADGLRTWSPLLMPRRRSINCVSRSRYRCYWFYRPRDFQGDRFIETFSSLEQKCRDESP